MKNLYQHLQWRFSALLIFTLVCLQFNSKAYQLMSTNFYIVGSNGSPTLKDGNISIYDTPYINGVDWNDGTKMKNNGENWGLIRDAVSLVVERRQLVTGADTAFFNMWGMQQRNYRFEVTMKNFDPLTVSAYVWDNFLQAITPVDFSGITTVNFTVDTHPGSWAAGRFQLIYTSPAKYAAIYAAIYGALPANITRINAVKKDGEVVVNWSAEKEVFMNNYVVEHSADGQHFKPLQTVSPFNTAGSHSYTYNDMTAVSEDHFYRIQANTRGGKIAYSNIAKIGSSDKLVSISVYPNPVVNKTVQLQWDNKTAAAWHTSLVYPNGNRKLLNTLNVPAGYSTSSTVLPANLPAGIYQLRFTDAANNVQAKTIIIL